MPRKHLDGIIGPVFQSAKEVDWAEVRGEWEELTGKKLHFSFWQGFLFWLILVGLFVYLQAGFFGLYFSRPYLEQKVQEAKAAIQGVDLEQTDLGEILQAENSFSDLKQALVKKGQFFVFLSYNPLFQDKAVDLSRTLLVFEKAEILKQAIFDYSFDNPTRLKRDLRLGVWNLKEMKTLIGLIKAQEIAPYKGKVRGGIEKAEEVLEFANRHFNSLAWFFGLDQERHYLLLFPNNKEARNWGGFSGTYGELKLNGKDYSLFVKDIYYLDYLLRGHSELKKPASANSIPLSLYPDQKIFPEKEWDWYVLRNTPTSLDFKTNAQRAIWVYENIHKQNQVDGLIALTPDLVISFLDIVGPISMPDYGVNVSADNFREVIEYKVEVDNPFKRGDRTKDPKQILRDLAPKLLEKLKKADLQTKIKIAQALLENLNKKQVLLYFEEKGLQDLVEEYNWGGRLNSYPYDYIAVYNTNLNGRKSSLSIKRELALYSHIFSSGLVKNRLELTFSHEGEWKELNGGFIEGDVEDLVEVVLPKGVMLKRVLKGKEEFTNQIKESSEGDKTIFFFKFHFNPGEKMHFVFEYTLPQLVQKKWGVLFQKQPGQKATKFLYQIESDKPIKKLGEGIGGWQSLDLDREFVLEF